MASVKCGLILSHLYSLPGPTRGAEAGTGPPHVAGQRHLPKASSCLREGVKSAFQVGDREGGGREVSPQRRNCLGGGLLHE